MDIINFSFRFYNSLYMYYFIPLNFSIFFSFFKKKQFIYLSKQNIFLYFIYIRYVYLLLSLVNVMGWEKENWTDFFIHILFYNKKVGNEYWIFCCCKFIRLLVASAGWFGSNRIFVCFVFKVDGGFVISLWLILVIRWF